MRGLLLKDFFVITKQLKIFLIVIPIMALAGGAGMATFAVLLGSVLPMTAIAYDESSRWNELAVMLPYSRRDLVLCKYLLGYICMAGAAILVLLGIFIRDGAGGLLASDGLAFLLISLIGGLFFIAVNTPILFKFGAEKGRFVFIIAMVVVGVSGPILSGLEVPMISIPSVGLCLIILAGAILLNFLSVMLTLAITKQPKRA